MGVNREVSGSGFLLGNPVYLCLKFLGFSNFAAGFSAKSSVQMVLQEELARKLGFCRGEDGLVGSWSDLSRSKKMSEIHIATVQECAKKDGILKLKKQPLGMINDLMCSLAEQLSATGGTVKVMSGLSLCAVDFSSPPSGSADEDLVLYALLGGAGKGDLFSAAFFADAGALAVTKQKVGAGGAEKRHDGAVSVSETCKQGKSKGRSKGTIQARDVRENSTCRSPAKRARTDVSDNAGQHENELATCILTNRVACASPTSSTSGRSQHSRLSFCFCRLTTSAGHTPRGEGSAVRPRSGICAAAKCAGEYAACWHCCFTG